MQIPGVFISYRRDDSAGHAGALLRELHGRIGADQVREGLFALGTERAGEGRTPADFTPLVPMGRAVRWIVAAFLGFAVVFGGVGALLGAQQSRFDARALLAKAEVVTMIAVTGDDGQTLYRPELAYVTASGESVRAVTVAASRPPAYKAGQRVDVRYDPARPSEPVIDSFGARWLMPLIFGGFGTLFLLVGLVPPAARVWRLRLIRGLLVRGKPVLTAFHAVEEDATVTVNGRHPWRVVTEWRHPVSREMVQFRSPPIWDGPTEQARGRMITVLVDPDNFHRYAMDLSFLKGHRKPTPRRL